MLGIGGLVGSKRTELARMVCGADPLKGGVIKVSGKARRITNTRQAIDAGLGYLSENRKEDGLSLGLKIEENTIHCDMTAVSRRGFMNWKRVREVSDNYIKMLKTKGTSATQVVNLSGETSRRWPLPSGSTQAATFSSSMSPQGASTWPQRPRYTS